MRILLLSILLASCAIAPGARSPLREELAGAGGADIEQAVTKCLTNAGWKVDPFPGSMADAEVMTAAKNGVRTDVYIHERDMTPRITGGPDDRDAFWSCLPGELSRASSAAVRSGGS
jgi:hypothetical protein